ncbi:hypothetical protein KIW84_031928 [Lathyrus oleraceus]|uniref:Uncharacterized protein n=1 Tax=Pisum sativum TaxID=3888 RepID=A0A9D4XRW9_PEA|nr:hypothetical protein KIW84_031928 [Pisum sativum]
MPAKYSNMASLVGGPDMNMSEALRANNISTPQARPNQQASPGVDIATGLSFPRHLAVYPYSQLTLPLWHFANLASVCCYSVGMWFWKFYQHSWWKLSFESNRAFLAAGNSWVIKSTDTNQQGIWIMDVISKPIVLPRRNAAAVIVR